jgi:hypothetical protein
MRSKSLRWILADETYDKRSGRLAALSFIYDRLVKQQLNSSI